jgi:hypothetical protein
MSKGWAQVLSDLSPQQLQIPRFHPCFFRHLFTKTYLVKVVNKMPGLLDLGPSFWQGARDFDIEPVLLTWVQTFNYVILVFLGLTKFH